jgi:2-polyprenyl-3-methyl-5-hydroxy-6-metoxy-1,4-benzoquinol methylase
MTVNTNEARDGCSFPRWCCPQTGASLTPRGEALVADNGLSYPIIDGIPRFVPSSDYAAAFGAQWNRYARTQLDSYTRTTVTRDRLKRCLGDELWASLADKQVLEAGCGAGRFTEILLERQACVTSIDLSEAVVANRLNCPISASHRIAQADITSLPFAPCQYDIVVCLGVVQHTPSPEKTIDALFGHVRPGGYLVIDHYRRNAGWYLSSKPLVRQVLKRLPSGTALAVTSSLVALLLPLHRVARRRRVLHSVLARVSPIIHYYGVYEEFSDAIHREWSELDTHDSLTDWFKHWRSEGEVRRALESVGAVDIWSERGGIGIEARGRAPGGDSQHPFTYS